MISFDASDIFNWADRPDAHHQLPELIRRLVMATVPMPSLLDMPSGSSVGLPGWDGLLVVEKGNRWVPNGASAWEFSCEKNPKRKTSADYKKRTADPQGVDKSKTTFVFVTSRRWTCKREWTRERREDGQWADVRVLDADDLVAWLEQAQAVALWFARLIGKLPATGFVPLDEWWDHWSAAATPRISPELVTAGRQDQVKNIARWFQGGPDDYYVQGDTREEAIAFLAASARLSTSQWGKTLLAKAIVALTPDAWRSLEGHSSPLVLVRDFSGGNVSAKIAVSRGHHVMTPLDESDDPRGNVCRLPRLGRDETQKALAEIGLSEARSRALARRTARRLPIMRRQLIDEAGGPTPEWASPSTPRSIVALVLIGQWQGDCEGDQALVAELVGQPYETLESDVTDQTLAADSPLTKVGENWRFVSHEEAWHLLAPKLTSSDLKRFERVVVRVLGAVSPKFELPINERHTANVVGKVLPHSEILRHGIARSLALMGVHPDRAKNVENASYTPPRVVSTVLGGGKGWQIWATLGSDLEILAEASPEAFLESVERDLDVSPSPFQDLLAQEGDGLFGGVPHADLLWALERLAWAQDYFARVAKILARLAEIDPGGQISNRPAESLCSLFLSWIRFSEASDEDRLQTLKMLLNSVPRAGWRLLVGAYPSSHGSVLDRRPPSWRPWAQDGAPLPTDSEWRSFVGELEQLLLGNVGASAERWADLVGILSNISPDARKRAIELLSRQTNDLRKHPALRNLLTKLREKLHLQRTYPDAKWAIEHKDVETLASVYQKLTPSDPVQAHAWLFDVWPHLPEGELYEYTEAAKTIAEKRQRAVQAAYEDGGVPAVIAIAEVAEMPGDVGAAFVLGVDPRLALDLALEHLESAVPNLRNMAHGAFMALYNQSGWTVLEEAIRKAKTGGCAPQALADIYLVAPALRETWQRLDREDQETQTAYWKTIRWHNAAGWDAEDMAFAVRQLLSVRQSAVAIKWLAFEPMSDEVVIQILEAAPADVDASADLGSSIDAFKVEHLFKKLDKSANVPDRVIAQLEIPYVGMPEYDRPQLALHREVTREPSLFADLISWAFKRSDGREEEVIDEQTRQNRARIAFRALWGLHLLPGLMENGSVDGEVLSAWVDEVRRLCRERDRADIGDQQIGQLLANAPAGVDGVWPCEPVRDLLDALASRHVGIGFIIGKGNLRGMTTRGLLEGGEQERSLADRYRKDAAKIAARRPFTANLLRELAGDLERWAGREDNQADWLDRFGS